MGAWHLWGDRMAISGLMEALRYRSTDACSCKAVDTITCEGMRAPPTFVLVGRGEAIANNAEAWSQKREHGVSRAKELEKELKPKL